MRKRKRKQLLGPRTWARESKPDLQAVIADVEAFWFEEGYNTALWGSKSRGQDEPEILDDRNKRAFNRGFALGIDTAGPKLDDARALWFELREARKCRAF